MPIRQVLSFKTLREANVTRNKLWDKDNQIGLLFRAVEFGGEAGEVLNIIKKIERENIGLVGSRVTSEMLGDELADAVICADLIAMHQNIDLAERVAAKFNNASFKHHFNVFIGAGDIVCRNTTEV